MRYLLAPALALLLLVAGCDGSPAIASVTIAAVAEAGDTVLHASVTPADSDQDEIGYRLQWTRNGADIAGATEARLSLAAAGAGAGDTIAVRVVATQRDREGAARTSEPLTVAAIEGIEVTPQRPKSNQQLTAAARTTGTSGPASVASYQWTKNGVDIPGATGASLDLSVAGHGDEGDVIAVRAAIADSRSVSAPRVSAPTRVEGLIALEIRETSAYYDVGGATTREIFEAISRAGLADDLGRPAYGMMRYRVSDSWAPAQSAAGCSIEKMTVDATVTITLPRFDSAPPPALRERWDRFAAAVETHERRHVSILREHLERLRAELEGIPSHDSCPALDREVERVLDAFDTPHEAAQAQFHRDEDRRIEQQCAPLLAEFEAAERRLDEIDGRVASLDRDLQLFAQRGDAARYNAALAARNALVAPQNAFVRAALALTDDFRWCRAS